MTEATQAAPLLEARNISKAFPGVQALEGVNLHLHRNEILAVIGENGAGKTTLMNILAGVLPADTGTILRNGHTVRFASIQEAEQNGIALIHQELNLADNLDVAGNLFLGREPTWGGPLALIDRRIYRDAEAITHRLGLECRARTRVMDLSVGQRQLVEIGRALSLRSAILIMDEPTSSLSQRETDRLFQVIRDLKRQGVSILYISHRLKEVELIADRVTVLRDGRNAGELAGTEIRHEAMVRLMVGRELKQFFRREFAGRPNRGPLLQVRGLRWAPGQVTGVDFTLYGGEIVGVAGLMGAGRTELAETLFALRKRLAGEIVLEGRKVENRKPAQAIAAGIFLIPEDRRLHGLILPASVGDNISLPSLDQLNWLRLIALGKERELAYSMCGKLNIRTPSTRTPVSLLSGGNQQKVVLAKWLARTPRLLILDEPTRGIDVGAKSELYGLMDQLAGQGVAILMISSDLEEIMGMSDRVLVMHQGRLAGELSRQQLSEAAVMNLATGGRAQS